MQNEYAKYKPLSLIIKPVLFYLYWKTWNQRNESQQRSSYYQRRTAYTEGGQRVLKDNTTESNAI